jgi:magnesium transporter
MEWHRILDPNSPELDRLAERYHLHPLHIEDCRHRNQSATSISSSDRISSLPCWKTIARKSRRG